MSKTDKTVRSRRTAVTGKEEAMQMGQAVKLLGAVGGAAVIFYAVGFVTVQSFLFRNGYAGMFWLTDEFYRDAGAKFLLEMVRAPLTAWTVFFPLLVLMYFLLIPRGETLNFSAKQRTVWRYPLGQCILLVAMMAIVYVFALNFGDISRKHAFAAVEKSIFFVDPAGGESLGLGRSVVFFSIVMPLALVAGIFLFRFHATLKAATSERRMYQFVGIALVVYFAIIPIAYGMYLYDWRIVSVQDPRALGGRYEKEQFKPGEVWLVGEFSGRYVFLRADPDSSRRTFDTVDAKEINRLNLDPRITSTLKTKLEAEERRELRYQADASIYDDMGLKAGEAQ